MNYQIDIGRPTVVKFDAKPSADVRAALKRYGYRWNPGAGHWWNPSARGAAELAGFLDGQRNLIQGIPAAGYHKCWTCVKFRREYRDTRSPLPYPQQTISHLGRVIYCK